MSAASRLHDQRPQVAAQRVSGALPRRRATAKATAQLDTAAAMFDRRAPRAASGRGSWHRSGATEECSRVRMWCSRQEWAADVRAWLESAEAIDARSAVNRKGAAPERVVSIELATAVGLLLALFASGDGRDVTAANATIARVLGVHRNSVVRARTALRAGGFEAVVAKGGYMTSTERAEAAAKHGGDQRRCASTTALTHPPKRIPGALPRRGSTGDALSTPRGLHKRGSAAARTKRTPSKPRQPVSLSTQRLAACLVDRDAAARDANGAPIVLAALDPRWRGQHIGQVWTVLIRLAPLMQQLGIPSEPATLDEARAAATDLIAVRTWWSEQFGGQTVPAEAANPLGEFYAATRRALDAAAAAGYQPPSAYRRRIEAEAAANLARQHAALEADRALRARISADPAVDAAIEDMHRRFGTSPRPSRWPGRR